MKLRTPLALAVSFINAGFAYGAFAAEVEPNKKALEEVIVTATKRETNLMDTPIAITVIGQDELSREGIANVKDIGKLVPNMDITFDSSQSAPVISMRGVRSTNITELGDPAVGLHLDGVYSPRPQGAMALMFDVERVEAQRGPQGTLFGRNSTVGNINIITKRPDLDAFDASIGLELARWNHQQVRGMVNIPVSDTFALRGSFMQETRDSYLKGFYDPNQWDTRYLPDAIEAAPKYTGPDSERSLRQRERWGSGDVQELVKADPSGFYNNSDQYSFRLAGMWQPSDDFSWLLTYERFQDSSAGGADTLNCKMAAKRILKDGDGNLQPLQGCESVYGPGADEYTVNVGVPGFLDLSIESLRSNLRWDFSDTMALVYNAGSATQVRSQYSDQDRGITGWDMSIFFKDATFKSQSHELQLQSTGTSRLQWITGIFAFQENNNMQGGWINSGPNADYWNQPDRTLSSFAGFAQGTYSLTDDLSLTLGYRRTKDTKEDVGGHNMSCNGDRPNQANPSANGGKCFPAWDRDAFNQLPTDYFWDSSIYTVATNNDNKGEWAFDNYRLGLDYDLSDSAMIFGYIANGTKSGGIGDVVVQYEQDPLTTAYPTDAEGNRIVKKRWGNTFNPEEVVTYEAGIKTDLFDSSLRLMATLFYSDYQDMQVASAKPLFPVYEFERLNGEPTGRVTSNGMTVFQTDNIGKAAIKGLEVEFEWKPFENGNLKGYFTLLDTEITSDFIQQWSFATTDLFMIDNGRATDPTNSDLTTNLKGNELPSSPKYSININYSHLFWLGDGSNLMPWVGMDMRASSYLSIFNSDKHEAKFVTPTPDAYSDRRAATQTINLGLKYSAPQDAWSLEAFVNNATNEVDFYWAGTGDGVIKGPVSMPRFYGVRANYQF